MHCSCFHAYEVAANRVSKVISDTSCVLRIILACVGFLLMPLTSLLGGTTEAAKEWLLSDGLSYDMTPFANQQVRNSGWVIETFEDVTEITGALHFATGHFISASSYASVTGGSHMTNSEFLTIKDRFGTNDSEYIYVFPNYSQNLGEEIELCCGIHSAPPSKPADMSQEEFNSIYSWPCSTCPNVGGHTDTRICMHQNMGIQNTNKVRYSKVVTYPGQDAIGINLPSDWQWTTVGEWRTMVQKTVERSACHSCLCPNSGCYTYTCSLGHTHWHHSGATRYCCDASFSPTTILKAGVARKPWEISVTGSWKTQIGLINWRDRTPPEIRAGVSTSGGNYKQSANASLLPELRTYQGSEKNSLDEYEYCTTGDYCVPAIKFYDENIWATTVTHQIALLTPENENFRFCRFIPSNSLMWAAGRGTFSSPIRIPDNTVGEITYAMFAWDASKNLNPSQAIISDNHPETCYGVRYTDPSGTTVGGTDLGRDPVTALPFPVKDTHCPDPSTPLSPSGAGHPISKGEALIADNDYPNIMIALVNTAKRARKEHEYTICFPPPPSVASWTLFPDLFAQATAGVVLTNDLWLATQTVQFMPLAVDYGNGLNLTSMGGPNDQWQFFKGCAALEDFSASDNDTNGIPFTDVSSSTAVGKRLGTGKSMTAVFVRPIEEDVEHELWIYAEDNARYTNRINKIVPSATDVSPSPYPNSGVRHLVVTCNDEQQQLKIQPGIGDEKAWETPLHGPFKVIFREPTPEFLATNANPNTDLIELGKKRPSIKVEATDAYGNTRTVQIFFQIQDVRTQIRVLQDRIQ